MIVSQLVFLKLKSESEGSTTIETETCTASMVVKMHAHYNACLYLRLKGLLQKACILYYYILSFSFLVILVSTYISQPTIL